MKKFYLIIILSVITIFFAFKQDNDKINASFKIGNSVELAKYFSPQIELTLFEEFNSLTKAKAEVEIKTFFEQHEPVSFLLVHEGTSPTGLKYVIGTLETKSGSFRVTYYLKNQQGKSSILQLSIDTND